MDILLRQLNGLGKSGTYFVPADTDNQTGRMVLDNDDDGIETSDFVNMLGVTGFMLGEDDRLCVLLGIPTDMKYDAHTRNKLNEEMHEQTAETAGIETEQVRHDQLTESMLEQQRCYTYLASTFTDLVSECVDTTGSSKSKLTYEVPVNTVLSVGIQRQLCKADAVLTVGPSSLQEDGTKVMCVTVNKPKNMF